MPKDSDDNYTVGFGKPPKHTRFKKGQSGNPKGRPSGSKDFSTLIDNELEKRVIVKENGRSKMISKRMVFVTQLVNKAATGSIPATKVLLPQMERREEAKRRALAQSETPTTLPTLSEFRKALKYLDDGIEPSDDDDSSKS